MKPIAFEEANVIYAKDQEQYGDLPSFKYPDETGTVVSCWKLSFWERVKLLFTGKLWLTLMTFHNPLQPIYMTVDKEEVIDTETSRMIIEQKNIDRIEAERKNNL